MIMKKLIGAVTEEEKLEIQVLFERRNGLNEWARIVTGSNEMLYEKLVKDFPDICNRVNLGYIASFLGITQPSLSRIRAKR